MSHAEKPKRSSMDSTFPVELPEDLILFLPQLEFEAHIRKLLAAGATGNENAMQDVTLDAESEITLADAPSSPAITLPPKDSPAHPFMSALHEEAQNPALQSIPTSGELNADNKMLTENAAVAYRSTNSALVDLFGELEKVISGPHLLELLEAAWKEDANATLKIVWNARSIHLGKGEKDLFYRCLGWMRVRHPMTVLINLQWIFRSVIEKKVKKVNDDDPVLVDIPEEGKEKTIEDHEVLNGVSHGYWKDLANILVLASQDQFSPLVDSKASILHKKNEQPKRTASTTLTSASKSKKSKLSNKTEKTPLEQDRTDQVQNSANFDGAQAKQAKEKKHCLEAERHAQVLEKFTEPFYRALHFTVARLFAQQLREDLKRLNSGKPKNLNRISYAAKWSPSLEGFHDKYTFLASTIAEALFPEEEIADAGDNREMYIKRAREKYRQTVISPLRKALLVVERDITANTFEKIHYDRVPSIAMDIYKNLFIKKDFDHFGTYINHVAEGKARISGGVLDPATLVKQARGRHPAYHRTTGKDAAKSLIEEKVAELESKVVDGQWETLVKRIKDSGKISSSIAVCDVSGSMGSPTFRDGTCPMDTSLGLGLLLSEITEAPFGGSIITFDSKPRILEVGGSDDKRTFTEKIRYMEAAPWGMSTDFIAVFEKLLLPLAIKNNLKPEDMVKQIFVFSDMQFNQACDKPWETAYQRIKGKFSKYGYELPTLIFWNLAGGRADYLGYGDPVAPKPVTKDITGTAIVSGYSAAQMKTFLDSGEISPEEETVEEDVMVGEEGIVEVKKQQQKIDPLANVMRVINRSAYDMLKVVD
jgi:hypothetical protein